MLEIPWGKILTSEFDYNILMSALSSYSQPRKKIHTLLKKQDIVRVKKGLYVFGDKLQKGRPLPSMFRLANLIHGPSYVSLETALEHHGLIPERTFEVTSISPNQNKVFKTPLGRFSYVYLRSEIYADGFVLEQNEAGFSFLIASPEKALLDKVWFTRMQLSVHDVANLIFDDLRINRDDFYKLKLGKLKELAALYKNKIIDQVVKLRGEK